MERNRITVVWGALLILLGLVLLLDSFHLVQFLSHFVWSAVLAAAGLPFLLIYARNQNQWWALIPGITLVGVALGILVGGQFTPIVILGSISLSFWIIYLTDRKQWWGLVPAWILTSVALILMLGEIGLVWFVAPFVMFAMAAPFFLVYLANPDQWWALIPAGVLGAIGVALVADQVINASVFWAILLILLGLVFVYRALRHGARAEPPSPGEPPEELR